MTEDLIAVNAAGYPDTAKLGELFGLKVNDAGISPAEKSALEHK